MDASRLIVYAGIEFGQFGQQLGFQLGIGRWAGGVLMSLIFMALFLFPVLFLCRSNPTIPAMFTGIGSMVVCVAVGWLDAWVLLLVFVAVSLMFASSARDWITGRGGGS